jgi:hypothetical protein
VETDKKKKLKIQTPKSRPYYGYLSALTLIFSFNSFSKGVETGKSPILGIIMAICVA